MSKRRSEPWFNPRFWVAIPEYRFSALPAAAHLEPCHDCGTNVVVMFDGICTALVRPLLWICPECANTRLAVHGRGWRDARRYADRPAA